MSKYYYLKLDSIDLNKLMDAGLKSKDGTAHVVLWLIDGSVELWDAYPASRPAKQDVRELND